MGGLMFVDPECLQVSSKVKAEGPEGSADLPVGPKTPRQSLAFKLNPLVFDALILHGPAMKPPSPSSTTPKLYPQPTQLSNTNPQS